MSTLLIIIFCIGFCFITLEGVIRVDKAATALITGTLCWLVNLNYNATTALPNLQHSLGSISEILFFLLGAMAIVEVIDAYDGFEVIARKIKITNTTTLIFTISIVTFFLSAILDNLTTTIVVISIVSKIVSDVKIRMYLAGLTVICANAGGAWSPMGDVTSSMLWIGGQINTWPLIQNTFLACVISALVPAIIFVLIFKKNKWLQITVQNKFTEHNIKPIVSKIILLVGIFIFILIPIVKTIYHVPPYLLMLLGLGIIWLLAEILQLKNVQNYNATASALQKIDTPSILFFAGILLSVSALENAGVLSQLALNLSATISNTNALVFCMGLLSAVIDNVPLVAATQAMYSLQQFCIDNFFWHFVAYCAGTGGSILLIGSAAGVVAGSLENISFGWYFKHISWIALLAYILGAIVMVLF